MGTLVRLLLRIFGIEVRVAGHLSEVSKTIDSLPGPKRDKWFWGGLLHFIPVAVALGLLFSFRASQIQSTARENIALLLAAAWAWLGPTLIWYYENITLLRFARNCRAVIADSRDYRPIRKVVLSGIYDFYFCRYFTPIWMAGVALAFLSADNLTSSFGVTKYRDVFWWFILLGVLLFAYYTSLGFCLCYKAYRLTLMVSKARLDSRIYHVDGVFGLSFIGDFAFSTAAMFFSGWLFAPLIMFSVHARTAWQYLYSTQVLLLEMFFVFTLLSFLIPIYIVHYKILREKFLRSQKLYVVANNLARIPEKPLSDDHIKKFDFAKKLIAEVQAIPNWPLRIDTVLKFSFTSIFVPTFVGLVAAILKAKAGAP